MDRSIWKQQLRSLTLQAPATQGSGNSMVLVMIVIQIVRELYRVVVPVAARCKSKSTATIVPDSQTVCANGVNHARIRY
jgi:hypothetical protein